MKQRPHKKKKKRDLGNQLEERRNKEEGVKKGTMHD